MMVRGVKLKVHYEALKDRGWRVWLQVTAGFLLHISEKKKKPLHRFLMLTVVCLLLTVVFPQSLMSAGWCRTPFEPPDCFLLLLVSACHRTSCRISTDPRWTVHRFRRRSRPLGLKAFLLSHTCRRRQSRSRRSKNGSISVLASSPTWPLAPTTLRPGPVWLCSDCLLPLPSALRPLASEASRLQRQKHSNGIRPALPWRRTNLSAHIHLGWSRSALRLMHWPLPGG